MPKNETGNTQHRLPYPFHERQGNRRLGLDTQQATDDDIAALLHTDRTRYRESHGFQRLPEALDDESGTDADVDPEEMQYQANLDAAEQPGNQVPQRRQRHAPGRPKTTCQRVVQPADLARRGPP